MLKNYLKFQRKGRNNLNTEYQQEEEIIRLTELFSLLKRHFLKIAGAGLVCAILGFTVTQFIIKPVYEARAKMIVNTRQNQTGIVTNDQINSAKNLVDTYAVIIRSRAILQPIIDNFDMNMTYAQLQSMVSVSPVNNTQVMEIKVKSTNPAQAKQVLEQILIETPSKIIETVEAGSVKTIEGTYLSDGPVSPNKRMNTLIAGVLGILAAVFIVVVRFLLDNTYKTELDIQNDLGLPVLGVIPSVETSGKSNIPYAERTVR